MNWRVGGLDVWLVLHGRGGTELLIWGISESGSHDIRRYLFSAGILGLKIISTEFKRHLNIDIQIVIKIVD